MKKLYLQKKKQTKWEKNIVSSKRLSFRPDYGFGEHEVWPSIKKKIELPPGFKYESPYSTIKLSDIKESKKTSN